MTNPDIEKLKRDQNTVLGHGGYEVEAEYNEGWNDCIDELSKRGLLAGEEKYACQHHWVSADNKSVHGASICRKCRKIVATSSIAAIPEKK